MVSSGFGAIGQKTQQLQNGLNKPKVEFRTYIRFLLLQMHPLLYTSVVQNLYKISTFVDEVRTYCFASVQNLYKISTFVDVGLQMMHQQFRTYIRFLLLQMPALLYTSVLFRTYIRFLLLQITLVIPSLHVQNLYKISTFVDIFPVSFDP